MIEVIDPKSVIRFEDLQDAANGTIEDTHNHMSTLLDRIEALAKFTADRKAI